MARRADTAFGSGFKDLQRKAPCCGGTVSLNELRYIWPSAFGRLALEPQNPNIADTTEEQDRKIAEYVRIPLRKIWAHV